MFWEGCNFLSPILGRTNFLEAHALRRDVKFWVSMPTIILCYDRQKNAIYIFFKYGLAQFPGSAQDIEPKPYTYHSPGLIFLSFNSFLNFVMTASEVLANNRSSFHSVFVPLDTVTWVSERHVNNPIGM